MTRSGLVFAFGLAAAFLFGSAAADEKRVKLSGSPTALTGSFGFQGDEDDVKKLRRSVSGVACARPGACLVAFDEGREARAVELSEGVFKAEATALPLAASGDEIDAEAVATDGAHYVVTGSHSMKRKRCEANEASRTVARFAVDRATGKPTGAAEAGDLLPAIKATPTLAARLGECLDDGAGLDIEGLAMTPGALWFGFRGPTAPGANGSQKAYILRVNAAAVFAGGDLKPELKTADVGARRAIRDMQAVDDGKLLLLVGPDDRPEHASENWGVVLWDPAAGTSEPLAKLDLGAVARRSFPGCKDAQGDQLKPESLLVAGATAAGWRVAILSDGLCDGGPIWFDVVR